LRDNATYGAHYGAPLMTGALMSARYDMEAAEPNVGQLRERVDVIRVDPVSLVEVRPVSVMGLHLSGRVA